GEAIKDITANPEHYKFECATAIVLMWHVAQHELFVKRHGEEEGNKRFDTTFANMKIGPWEHGSEIAYDYDSNINNKTDAPMAGDWRYFKTWDADEVGVFAGWQGENVIYLGRATAPGDSYDIGDEIYFGHPFGISSADHIIESLNGNRYSSKIDSAPEFIKTVAGSTTQLEGMKAQLKKTEGKNAALLHDLIPRFEERLAFLSKISDRLGTSKTKRKEVHDYLAKNSKTIKKAENSVLDIRIKFGAESDEYSKAEKAYEKLAQPLVELDEHMDRYDNRTLFLSNERLQNIKERLDLLKAKPAQADPREMAALKKEFALLSKLKPRDASAHNSGMTLLPSDK
ncbi:hypothetical protein KAI87_04325, partial [Myxococcota bacterium]|nr:hypothetical protein [Myxococcota bacterium]